MVTEFPEQAPDTFMGAVNMHLRKLDVQIELYATARYAWILGENKKRLWAVEYDYLYMAYNKDAKEAALDIKRGRDSRMSGQ